MTTNHLVLVGTRKGAFLIDPLGAAPTVRGPFCGTMPIQHVTWDPASRSLLAGAGSPWYGPTVWRSTDLGETWSQSSEGLTYGDDQPAVTRVWNITPANGALYAGVEPAGLFRSEDGGVTWQHVAGLRAHPSTPDWQPGNGGLILHSIVPHPTDPDAHVGGHLRGRHLPYPRWRCHVGRPEPWRPRGVHARPASGDRAVRAQAGTASRPTRGPVPAEPLWCLSVR